jgi:hypothetical protein
LRAHYSLPEKRWKVETAVMFYASFPAICSISVMLLAAPFLPAAFNLPLYIGAQAAAAGIPCLWFLALRRGTHRQKKIGGLLFRIAELIAAVSLGIYAVKKNYVGGYLIFGFAADALINIAKSSGISARQKARPASPKGSIARAIQRQFYHPKTKMLLAVLFCGVLFLLMVHRGIRCPSRFVLIAPIPFWVYCAQLPTVRGALRVRATLPAPMRHAAMFALWPVLAACICLAPLAAWVYQQGGHLPALWMLAAFAGSLTLTVAGAIAAIQGRSVAFVSMLAIGVVAGGKWCLAAVSLSHEPMTHGQIVLAVAVIAAAAVVVPLQIRNLSCLLQTKRLGYFNELFWKNQQEMLPPRTMQSR